jgi:xylan 1,4-beta-xylosidase
MKFDESKFDFLYGSYLLKFCISLCSLCSLWLIFFFANTQAQTYTNPVIAGDFPDPSVIRVGEDYYATATTGNWAPHFPLLHSKDLINWTVVGAIFDKKPAWAKGDFWAPEIAEDKGRFFVYYTARRDEGAGKKGTLCVAVAVADKPVGPWQDKGPLVCQEMGSIDGFFVRDEKGKPYLVWKEDGNDRQQPTWLYAQELDESGTKLKGKPKKLFRNDAAWENHVVEGSYIIRRDGWFYHFYSGNACCGRACNYALGVARAKTLLGKWEKNPANPILKENEAWQCPGHGTMVSTPDGRWFKLYHAYRKRSDAFNIGREALLDEVKWTADGWPVINNGRGASRTAAVPFPKTEQKRPRSWLEEFTDARNAALWSYPLGSEQKFLLENGFVLLAPAENAKDAAEKNPELVLAQRTVSGDYTATTRIDVSGLRTNESAGLSAYSWRTNAVGVSVGGGGGRIFTWRREGGKQTEIASAQMPKDAKAIYLRIKAADGEFYNFAFSADGENWREIGERVAESGVEGARVALIYSNGGASAIPGARFDWLRVVNDK